jgi:hypothetical protein
MTGFLIGLSLGFSLILLPSLSVVALCMIASDRALRREGNSRPAVDEVEPVVAGRDELGCLVAANDREAA